jgi:hypothetical protein
VAAGVGGRTGGQAYAKLGWAVLVEGSVETPRDPARSISQFIQCTEILLTQIPLSLLKRSR